MKRIVLLIALTGFMFLHSIVALAKKANTTDTAGIKNRARVLIDLATIQLKQGDTTAAATKIRLAQSYLPHLNTTDAETIKNKISTFFIYWVRLKNPASRGVPTQHQVKINSLIKTLDEAHIHDKNYFNTAANLATLSQNRLFYIYAKTNYAEDILNSSTPANALPVLDSLINGAILSNDEKSHILSLLVINTIRLNVSKDLKWYYDQLQAVNKATSGTQNQPEYLLATAMYLENSRQYKAAIAQYRNLTRLIQPGSANEQMAEGSIRLASLYGKLRKADSAMYYFTLARRVINTNTMLKQASALYKTAWAAYQHSNLPGATDTAYRQQLINTTKQLEYRYALDVKNQKIKLAAQQQQLNLLKYEHDRQRSTFIILSMLCLIVVITIIGYLLYLRRKQSALLYQAQVNRLKQEHRININKALAEAQLTERQRIAEQLHDEVGSMLAVARLNLSATTGQDVVYPVTPAQIKTTDKILAELATIIRRMSHQLIPVTIKKLGFKKSVLQVIDDINAANKVNVECVIIGFDDLVEYTDDFQTNFYYIIQELLQNILKHSGATKATLQLIEHPDTVNLMIEDNGTGFKASAFDKSGKGLTLLTSRLELYDGTMQIEDNHPNGSLIIIDIPRQNIVYSGEKFSIEYDTTLPGR